jgi:hypothetical protein
MMNEMESLVGPITRGSPVARIFWVILSLVGIAAAIVLAVVYSNPDLLAIMLAPLVILFYQWWSWPRRDSWTWTADGLEDESTGEKIPFFSIQGVTLDGRCQDPAKVRKRGWLAVHHAAGVALFHRNVRPDVRALYRGILEKVTLPENVPSLEKLEHYYQKQVALFGKDKVWAFNPRPHVWHGKSGYDLLLLWVALLLVSLLWLFLASRTPQGVALGAMGVYLIVVSLFGMLFTGLRHVSPAKSLGVKDRQNAGLVLGPIGIAMVQDPAVGQLKWEEIKSVKLGGGWTTVGGPSVYPPRALYLDVQGATIAIADIYDCPLPKIFQLVNMYWRKPDNYYPGNITPLAPSD